MILALQQKGRNRVAPHGNGPSADEKCLAIHVKTEERFDGETPRAKFLPRIASHNLPLSSKFEAGEVSHRYSV
jgi:hypothetical protein